MIALAFCSFCGKQVDEHRSLVKVYAPYRGIVVFCDGACRSASQSRLDLMVNDIGKAPA